MSSELNRLFDAARRELLDGEPSVDKLLRLGQLLLRVSAEQVDVSFAEFHNFAGRFPYSQDCDFGALILEYLADTEAAHERTPRLYREALWRARWCATGATSAGEGYARIEHVDRLLDKLKDATNAVRVSSDSS